MTFPVEPNMSMEKFREDIIDYYFPHFETGTETQKKLRQDYAHIGAFLSSRAKVLEALVPLEEQLRDHIVKSVPKLSMDQLKAFRPVSSADFKTHKALTAVLALREIEEGFNNPADYGVLHSQAMYATGTDRFDMQPGGRPAVVPGKGGVPANAAAVDANPIALPKGIPTVVGLDLHYMDFNRILLAHGYQFKDVGAGKEHGEYTHRLQWWAVCQVKKALGLQLSPIDIFKSMGLLAAKGSGHLQAGRHLYVWEALFDNFRSEGQAKGNKTEAYCTGTFNNPENFNSTLKNIDPAVTPFDANDSTNLFCLKMLVRIRHDKRARTEDQSYLRKLFTDKPKAVASANVSGAWTGPQQVAAALYWYTG